ncbi:MAG: hypothetical protein ABL868_12120 [Sulfuriferula sp.]
MKPFMIMELSEMIVLDTHIWVNWIVGGNGALPQSVVNAKCD